MLTRQRVQGQALDEESIAAPGDVRPAWQRAHRAVPGADAAFAAGGSTSGPFWPQPASHADSNSTARRRRPFRQRGDAPAATLFWRMKQFMAKILCKPRP